MRPAPNDAGLTSARALVAAGLFAAIELGLGVTIGGFFTVGRAEALVFLALRPWLLLLLVCLLARWGWKARAAGYALALLLAALGETLFLEALGAERPWREAVAGLAAGALLAFLLDLVVQLGRRVGRLGPIIGPLAGILLLLVPGGLYFYDRIVLGGPARAADARPDLMMMTALPIIWGEGGAFDPSSKPAESYKLLQREFRVRPLDTLSEATLSGRLLLLAQPRALAPTELVALDDWVRAGGRVLVLTDPTLDWPSKLPLGAGRRPPAIGLLAPLLDHWGVRLEPALRPTGDAILSTAYALPEPGWKLAVASPGRVQGPGCRTLAPGFIIRCRIGGGEALIVADADLLRDALWAPYGPARHQRTADNPLVVAEWLDDLAGIERDRVDRRVDWLDPASPRGTALALGFAPAGLALILAVGLGRRRRR